MASQNPIPTKVHPIYNNVYQASLNFQVQVYQSPHYVKPSCSKAMNSMMASLKPSINIDSKAIDILKMVPSSRNNSIFYIFDPSKYKPSTNEDDLKKSRKALQMDLREQSRRIGFTFMSHSTKHWGVLSYPEHYKFFRFGCNNKQLKKINDSMFDTSSNHYKLACTNGERLVHSRYHGNKAYEVGP